MTFKIPVPSESWRANIVSVLAGNIGDFVRGQVTCVVARLVDDHVAIILVCNIKAFVDV